MDEKSFRRSLRSSGKNARPDAAGSHPYKTLPQHCFWSRSHRKDTLDQIDPVVGAAFRITRKTRIATAGSCFAQNLARNLQKEDFNYFVTEAGHGILSDEARQAQHYGVFTARYGNLYTARQLRQLAERALGRFTPVEDVWEEPDGSFTDPFRPTIQKGGFVSRDSFDFAREQHFAAVRQMMKETEVFIFTFGLTEGWESAVDGAAFPICPGVSGGRFDAERHRFFNQTAEEAVEDFRAFAAMVREENPNCRFLITVSPVPLAATAREDMSVIAATMYSKSVLRVACEMLASSDPGITYFPSYEIITLAAAKGAYYQPDLRNVTETGVDHVMKLFFRHYANHDYAGAAASSPAPQRDAGAVGEIDRQLEVICEEMALDDGLNGSSEAEDSRRDGVREGQL